MVPNIYGTTPQIPFLRLAIGHKSANFRTYFKNKSVLETWASLQSRPSKFKPRAKWSQFLIAHVLFCCYFWCQNSNSNSRKDTFLNVNSYFIFTSLNYPHSLQNGLTRKGSLYLWIARCKFHFCCLRLVLWWVEDQTQPLDLLLAHSIAEISAPSKFTSVSWRNFWKL